jgi:HD-like signal output (HDOD) protein
MDRCAILKSMAARLANEEIAFPTHAMLALKVQRALDDPDCHVESAARLIKAEPLLSAKIVALANSSAFNGSGRPVTDVRMAISRLGFRNLHTLATSLVARQLAQTASPQESAFAARLWEHSAEVAALAWVIARKVTRVDPEAAMFAGMLHEIGGFYMISQAAAHPGLLDEDFASWTENGEADLGREVLRALDVPDAIIEAIETVWGGYLALPPRSLGDTILLADDLARTESPLRDLDGVPREGRAAAIDIALGQETLAEIMDESATELKSLLAALR